MITLILVISIALIACGKKYDKEIEEVTSLEAKDRNDSSDPEFNKYERKKSNIYVYEWKHVNFTHLLKVVRN